MISDTGLPPESAPVLTPYNGASDVSTEDRRARLRERLIDEAWRLLATEGLPAMQARRVAQAAGCSVGAIYNVFPDLDELILSANTRTMAMLGKAAAQAGAKLDPGLSVGERVKQLSHVYIEFAFANEMIWRSLFEYRATFRKPYPDWYRQAQMSAFSDLGGGVLGRQPDTLEQADLVETLWAALHGVVSIAMDARFRDVSRPAIEAQVDLLMGLIAPGVDAYVSGARARE